MYMLIIARTEKHGKMSKSDYNRLRNFVTNSIRLCEKSYFIKNWMNPNVAWKQYGKYWIE